MFFQVKAKFKFMGMGQEKDQQVTLAASILLPILGQQQQRHIILTGIVVKIQVGLRACIFRLFVAPLEGGDVFVKSPHIPGVRTYVVGG